MRNAIANANAYAPLGVFDGQGRAETLGANGQPVTVSTQVQGTISSVNVSQNPPMVTVGGQSYPISAIQSINSGSIEGVHDGHTAGLSLEEVDGGQPADWKR